MNNTVKVLLAFSLGAATGSLVAWKMLKNKYERIAQEDIDEYRAYADSRIAAIGSDSQNEETKPEEAMDEEDEEDPMAPLSNLIGRYTSDADRREKFVREPYVISPEEYDTLDGYECTSLTYHSDGILCDEWDNIIENPDDLVGEGFETHFDEYDNDPDSVFIRNEELKRDFEILRDNEPYAELHDIRKGTEE